MPPVTFFWVQNDTQRNKKIRRTFSEKKTRTDYKREAKRSAFDTNEKKTEKKNRNAILLFFRKLNGKPLPIEKWVM